MKANNTHISLETAKLLKDCKVACGQVYSPYLNGWIIELTENAGTTISQQLPAYTWQEILWEYPTEFFGNVGWDGDDGYVNDSEYYTTEILYLLQQKEYDKADKYLQDHCILIK